MAHYAEDCWDAEVETTYGWVECAGLADRSAYDLRAHTSMSKTELTAYEKYAEPREMEVTRVIPNKKELGVAFKKDAKAISDALDALSEEDALCMKVGTGSVVWITLHCCELGCCPYPQCCEMVYLPVELVHSISWAWCLIEV